ncbi:hypothetical protein T484DRAFT_1876621, partial [Baffinella frigidus]
MLRSTVALRQFRLSGGGSPSEEGEGPKKKPLPDYGTMGGVKKRTKGLGKAKNAAKKKVRHELAKARRMEVRRLKTRQAQGHAVPLKSTARKRRKARRAEWKASNASSWDAANPGGVENDESDEEDTPSEEGEEDDEMLSDVEGGEEEGEEGGGHFFAAASPKSKSAAASPKGDKARPSAAKAEEGGGATSAGKEPTKKKTKKQKEEEEEEETASVTLSSLTLSDVNSPPRRVHFDERGMQDDLDARERGEYGIDVIDEPDTPYEVSPVASSEDSAEQELLRLDMQERMVTHDGDDFSLVNLDTIIDDPNTRPASDLDDPYSAESTARGMERARGIERLFAPGGRWDGEWGSPPRKGSKKDGGLETG